MEGSTQCCVDDVSGDGRPLQRGASMTTTEHVDPAAMPSVDPELDDDGNPSDVRPLSDSPFITCEGTCSQAACTTASCSSG